MTLYDRRINFFGQEGMLGLKGADMLKFQKPQALDEAFTILQQLFNSKLKIQSFCFVSLFYSCR